MEERQILTHKLSRSTVWFIVMTWKCLPQPVKMFVRWLGLNLLKLVSGFAFHYRGFVRETEQNIQKIRNGDILFTLTLTFYFKNCNMIIFSDSMK